MVDLVKRPRPTKDPHRTGTGGHEDLNRAEGHPTLATDETNEQRKENSRRRTEAEARESRLRMSRSGDAWVQRVKRL